MELVEFRGWKLWSDPQTTRAAYGVLNIAPGELWLSVYDRNFDSARHKAYPSEVLTLFEELGIVYRYVGGLLIPERVSPNLYHYHGVFHFVGRIDPASAGEDPIRIPPRFCLAFSTGNYSPGFVVLKFVKEGFPVVQVDFETVVPWVIDEPEPKNLAQLPEDYDCQGVRPRHIHVKS